MGTVTSLGPALRSAVQAATLAPSIHNTQPWRFVVGERRLELRADPSRQLAVLDPTGRQLHVSLGCALFNARVSLAASGYRVAVALLPDAADAAVAARLEVAEDGGQGDPRLAALAAAVPRRQTNRRRFAEDPVPQELVASLVDAAAAERAVLHAVTAPDDRQTLSRLTQRADGLLVADPAYRAELRAWTTSDPARRDGVRAAVVPHVDGTAGDDVPIRDFDVQGAGWLPAQTRSSAAQCLLLLGTERDEPRSWLAGGQALERVWLELTAAGYVASLFTQPTEIAAVRAGLRRELRLSMWPHVLIRVGRGEPTPATLRRHVEEVLDERPT